MTSAQKNPRKNGKTHQKNTKQEGTGAFKFDLILDLLKGIKGRKAIRFG
jgi:hypothetical protein